MHTCVITKHFSPFIIINEIIILVLVFGHLIICLPFHLTNHNTGEKNNVESRIGNEDLFAKNIAPVVHMDAVGLESNGHLNNKIHKELFIGIHEEFEHDKLEEAESRLRGIIFK